MTYSKVKGAQRGQIKVIDLAKGLKGHRPP